MWSRRKFESTSTVKPRTSLDFAWVSPAASCFLMAYAILTTYEAYYLLLKLGSAVAEVPQADLPRHRSVSS